MIQNESGFRPSDISQWFWDIIRHANQSRENLAHLLLSMEKEALIRFEDEFLEAAAQLNDEPFLHYIDSDESEDGIEDITNWVVSQGEQYYGQVWDNPQLIPKHLEDPGNLHGVAGDVFWRRFGEEIQDWLA